LRYQESLKNENADITIVGVTVRRQQTYLVLENSPVHLWVLEIAVSANRCSIIQWCRICNYMEEKSNSSYNNNNNNNPICKAAEFKRLPTPINA